MSTKTVFLAAVAALSSVAAAADIRADWSFPTQSGAWRYGYSNSLVPVPSLVFTQYAFTSGGGAGTAELYNAGFGGEPHARLNRTSGTLNGVPPDMVSLHPGPNNQLSIARYIAPTATASALVTGTFFAGDTGVVDVYIVKNASTATPTSLFTKVGTGVDESFNLSVALAAGDTLDFVVGAAGSYFSDSTPITARIDAVPEPATMAALGFGALGLLRRRRRNA